MEVGTLYGRLTCGWLGMICVWLTRYGGKWVWLARRGRCTEFSIGVAGWPWSFHGKQT